MSIKPEQGRSEFLTLNADGATVEANVNGSVTPQHFIIAPPSGEVWIVNRLIPYIADGGTMDSDEYGNLGAALTNGIQVRIFKNGTTDAGDLIRDMTAIKRIKTNGGWGERCYDVSRLPSSGSGADAYVARWTFWNDNAGEPYRLIGELGHRVVVTINDDLTGLTEHTFRLGCYAEL